jgi:hypothetical protein
MKITGGCHCGSFSYEAEIDPEKILLCHCSDCQTLSGSAFRSIAFTRKGTFQVLKGTLKTYIKIAESGAEREQSFCPDCGTAIYATSRGEGPKVHGLRIGSIAERDQLVPKFQVWTGSQQKWVADIDSFRKIEKQ